VRCGGVGNGGGEKEDCIIRRIALGSTGRYKIRVCNVPRDRDIRALSGRGGQAFRGRQEEIQAQFQDTS